MERIAFDDTEALKKRVSPEFGGWSEPFEISQEMINQFADLTGDHQWIHVDVERCKKESPFGTTIAHGFLTLSLLPAMAAKARNDGYAIVGYGNAVNYGSDRLRFLAPVPAGSKVQCRTRLAGVEATPKGTKAIREIAIHVVGSERPAVLYQMVVLYQAPLA
ncbi:MAG: MaoC family dehydratase [Myxococcota bacterium]